MKTIIPSVRPLTCIGVTLLLSAASAVRAQVANLVASNCLDA